MSGIAALVIVGLFGCGDAPEAPKGPVPVPGTGGDPAPSSGSLPVVPTAGGLPSLPVPSEAPVASECSPCALLMEHAFEELREGQACTLCGSTDPLICEEGWPEPGTPDCETYDYLRNCIYARLGYTFDTAQEWRVTFSEEDWYEPDPDFQWSSVSPVQKRNAQVLRDLVKSGRCRR